MRKPRISTIHKSLINGQRKQMVEQIDEYGTYDFWTDYRDYLKNIYTNKSAIINYFTDATVSYFRITNR
jgi:hypothetical protein